MPVVLVVEPQCVDASKVLERLGGECICIPVAGPSSAAYALNTLQCDVVIVPGDKVERWDYAPLFSTMRLAAPRARLVCAPPARQVQAGERLAPVHVQKEQKHDPVWL